MISILVPQGLCLLASIIFLSRWIDLRSLKLLSFCSLFLELSAVFIITIGCSITQVISYTIVIPSFLCELFFMSPIIFMFDGLSGFFMILLLTALILCYIFLIEYFEYDLYVSNIIILSVIFSQSALCFFCTADLLSLIIFWEYISIISFLLVQHWSMRIVSIRASLKVFVVSQAGDIMLFLAFFCIITSLKITDIVSILTLVMLFNYSICSYAEGVVTISTIDFVCILSLAALLLKSAQVFFYPWLLDAMEAPVPISAQLHSSTLVIIGFYVVFRFCDILKFSQLSIFLIQIFGIITIIGGSILGFWQDDGKRLLACSTASQLGYVVVGISLALWNESLWLLLFCCCNKALIFTWFGVLMTKSNGLSDFRLIGSTSKPSIIERTGILLTSLNTTVLPGMIGLHVKALFLQGSANYDSFFRCIAVEILASSWMFSGLYLAKLNISLFCTTNRLNIKAPTISTHVEIKPFTNFNVLNNSQQILLSIAQICVVSCLTMTFYIWCITYSQANILTYWTIVLT